MLNLFHLEDTISALELKARRDSRFIRSVALVHLLVSGVIAKYFLLVRDWFRSLLLSPFVEGN